MEQKPNEWEKLLSTQNWQNYYNCNCKGGKRSYYSNSAFPTYEVRINRSRGTFSILNKNYLVGPSDWLYKLEEKLKHHAIFQEFLEEN